MTVDQIPFSCLAIRPLPQTPWLPAGGDRDSFDTDAEAAPQPRQSELVTGWPRVFPGL